ncbi:MAG: hypothetical protein CMP48_26580 [Rickettsiales bacterium]|nr:hypothetical protein [Rickettsiales bacterium]|tara:strand:- start:6433 stop:6774 length:342 start_codon:yes stop_codon:yes gene_type:complete
MKYLYIKDIKKRKLYNTIEKIKLIEKLSQIKILNYNNYFKKFNMYSKNIHFLIIYNRNIKINKIKYKMNTQINRRCLLTNRARGSLKIFRLSRSILRELILMGLIPGYKKSIW